MNVIGRNQESPGSKYVGSVDPRSLCTPPPGKAIPHILDNLFKEIEPTTETEILGLWSCPKVTGFNKLAQEYRSDIDCSKIWK